MIGHFQKRFIIKRPNSRSVTEMDLLSDHCPANIWTDTTLDLVYLLESIKICAYFTKYLPPDKWGEKREVSDAFLSCCVCVCEG